MGNKNSSGSDDTALATDATALATPMLPGSVACFGFSGVYTVDLATGKCHKISAFGGNWGGIGSSAYYPDLDVVFAFGTMGIYRCNLKDGTYSKHARGQWNTSSDKDAKGQLACYLGDGTAIYVGATAIYSVNLRQGGSYEKLAKGNWGGSQTLIYNADDNRVYVWGGMGVYRVDPKTGQHDTVATGNWSGVHAAAHIGGGICLCFGGTGIFRLNLQNGEHTKITGGMWGGIHIALYNKDARAIFAFGNGGIYKVGLDDGNYEKVVGGCWGCVHAAVYSSTGFEMDSVR